MATFQSRWITWLASMVGSAWPGSPWARMQAAHSSSSWVGLLMAGAVDELPLAPPLLLLDPKVVLVASLATCGEAEPPLHAAIPTAAAAARTASPPPDRSHRVVLSRVRAWVPRLDLSAFSTVTSSPHIP